MHIAIVPAGHNRGLLCRVRQDGAASVQMSQDLGETVKTYEAEDSPRWIVASLADSYPQLLADGVSLTRAHDVALTEAVLLPAEQRSGSPDLESAYARLYGHPPPPHAHQPEQQTLFDEGLDPQDTMARLIEVYSAQVQRLQRTGLRYLAACESAGGLVAAEMSHAGLPWRTNVHDEFLRGLLGPPPAPGLRPRKLQQLADQVSDAFGRPLNPDSPQQIIDAFRRAGHPVSTTRARELKELSHAAVAPLLRYKELARIYSAHGWNWARTWISDGPEGPRSPAKRFRPRYVVGGVVTGRWATDGGAALQIPQALRAAIAADEGWRLVAADAAQLEPRILAAMSGDAGMTAASAQHDMYAALAPTFGGSRGDAKLAMLSAMYGGTAGNATHLLHVLRRRYPDAYSYVTSAAKAGERGEQVSTWLGRQCPAVDDGWWTRLAGSDGSRHARHRGRFTRNFVVQGTAAEWSLVFMALLRRQLRADGIGELVFYQHDEFIVHCRAAHAHRVAALFQETADATTTTLFDGTKVRIPLDAKIVRSYSEVK